MTKTTKETINGREFVKWHDDLMTLGRAATKNGKHVPMHEILIEPTDTNGNPVEVAIEENTK